MRVCSGCGRRSCEGECYTEEAQAGLCRLCREPLDEGVCKYCDRLTVVRSDPFAHIRAHDIGDFCDRLWKQSKRREREPNKPLPTDK